MSETNFSEKNRVIESMGIKNATVLWNLPSEELAEISVEQGLAKRASSGAINVSTGEFTGRSPNDRFIVFDNITEDSVWWGDINLPFETHKFDLLYDHITEYLSEKEIYVRDGYACADPKYRMNIRFITELPWSNMFTYNMFLRPTEDELVDFDPEWTVISAPGFHAGPTVHDTRQHNFAILNFTRKVIIVGGTGYTGEIKKGIFSALNFILPHNKNVLAMHCSANKGRDGDTALFFGLSGTGKTTLSADPSRYLIGDDEHGWSDDSVFNFEGGCYAKCIDLSAANETDIFNAIKQGALLENIIFYPKTDKVDFKDGSITENTRVSYPIHHIRNIAEPSVGDAPKNIFFLTADAFGVLPPISKLTPAQAAYQFISGYTAKVAGTEAGITEPVTVFSACFGAPFMPLHPTFYGEMLSKKMQESGARVWLVNTGWSGGPYGVGKRMSLKITRSLISSALEGKLDDVEYKVHDIFGLEMPTSCPDVPDEVLNPVNTWEDKDDYNVKANHLANEFIINFAKFKDDASKDVLAAAPKPNN
jgi:phosphoenolpyruvate carboxykinase (ATP)